MSSLIYFTPPVTVLLMSCVIADVLRLLISCFARRFSRHALAPRGDA